MIAIADNAHLISYHPGSSHLSNENQSKKQWTRNKYKMKLSNASPPSFSCRIGPS